jgi:hypothetical protein
LPTSCRRTLEFYLPRFKLQNSQPLGIYPRAEVEDLDPHHVAIGVKIQDDAWADLLRLHNGRFVEPKIEGIAFFCLARLEAVVE